MKKIIVLFLILAVQLPAKSYAQTRPNVFNILVAERKDSAKMRPPFPGMPLLKYPPIIFKEGKRVLVKTYHDGAVAGRIKDIADSTITVAQKKINISQIKSIRVFRGIEPLTIGVSTLAFAIAAFSYSNEWIDAYAGFETSLGCIIIGSCLTIVGIIEMASTKTYRMDKKFKLIVRTIG